MPRQKGTPKTGGRTAGTPNKLSTTVKDNVVAVFEGIGGIEKMKEWAVENPTPFYNIYSKLLPVEAKLEGAGENGEHLMQANITVSFISPDDNKG